MTAYPTAGEPHTSAWTGWVVFGAAMLMIGGAISVIQGFVALLGSDFFLTTPDGLAVEVTFTTLGWVQVGLGVLGLAVGIGMLLGVAVALIAGVVLAVVSAVVHLATIAAYPAWSVLVIAIDVLVIYAVVAHGREMKQLR